MSRIVGIDLGTTHSLIAILEAGIPFVLADSEGRRLTPSVVHYPPLPAEPSVGWAAKRGRAAHPGDTVSSVKRLMGRRAQDLSPADRNLPYSVVGAGAEPVQIQVGNRRFSPEEISAEILKQLKSDAEQSMGESLDRAVITVPAYFNDAQRQATLRAGELAGFQVERIVSEPTAAALAYGLNRLRDRSRIAVYDLGGGTFDLSILELHEGVFQVLSTHGDTRLGGDDIDARILEALLQGVEREKGPGAREVPGLVARLQEAAEEAKIALSSVESTEILLPFLWGDYSLTRRLTRGELEELALPILEKTRAHCGRALADARLESKDLDQVILVGGQTRMPRVRSLVSEIFKCVEFSETRGSVRLGTDFHPAAGPVLNTSQNPDEAVALGAAIQAAILSGSIRNMVLMDVTPLSLGLETFGGLMNVLIPRNTTIPVKAGELFTTAMDQQPNMLIHVLQGERERAVDNWTLGKFVIDFARGPRGSARVGVQFEIDANGVLKVLARDVATGRETIVPMASAVDVDDAAVQKMVEESVEHAWEDMHSRQWIEAKLRAQSMLAAVEQGLTAHRHELEAGECKEMEAAMEEVRRVLAREDVAAHSGDVAALKTATTALDLTTQRLASLMMEKALEAALRKKGLI